MLGRVGTGSNCLTIMLEMDGGRERSWVLDGGGVRRAGVVVLGVTVRIVRSFLFFLGPASEFFFFFHSLYQ